MWKQKSRATDVRRRQQQQKTLWLWLIEPDFIEFDQN